MISPDKLYIGDSSISGRGVFAKVGIKEGEVLEECHYMLLAETNFKAIDRNLTEYVFAFEKTSKVSIVFGFGSIYNHSREPNADWEIDTKNNLYRFFAISDISEGEEILLDYVKTCSF